LSLHNSDIACASGDRECGFRDHTPSNSSRNRHSNSSRNSLSRRRGTGNGSRSATFSLLTRALLEAKSRPRKADTSIELVTTCSGSSGGDIGEELAYAEELRALLGDGGRQTAERFGEDEECFDDGYFLDDCAG
jgi:hypothetical protein